MDNGRSVIVVYIDRYDSKVGKFNKLGDCKGRLYVEKKVEKALGKFLHTISDELSSAGFIYSEDEIVTLFAREAIRQIKEFKYMLNNGYPGMSGQSNNCSVFFVNMRTSVNGKHSSQVIRQAIKANSLLHVKTKKEK